MGKRTRRAERVPSDAEAAARNPPSPRLRRIKGGDEAAGAQTGAEVRAVPPAILKTSPHEDLSLKPVGSQFAK